MPAEEGLTQGLACLEWDPVRKTSEPRKAVLVVCFFVCLLVWVGWFGLAVGFLGG